MGRVTLSRGQRCSAEQVVQLGALLVTVRLDGRLIEVAPQLEPRGYTLLLDAGEAHELGTALVDYARLSAAAYGSDS